MEKKGLKYIILSFVTLLSLSSILLFGILPMMNTSVAGIPGLEVSLAQEEFYSSPNTCIFIECFLDTSNMDLEYPIRIKFTTNTSINGEATSHISNTIGYVDHVNVTLYPTSANLGETIEVTITILCSIYYHIAIAYVIII